MLSDDDTYRLWACLFDTVFDDAYTHDSEKAVLAASVACTNKVGREFAKKLSLGFSELMTKTEAKKEFCLSDGDLCGLHVIRRKNPMYASAAPMLLYNTVDLVETAYQKYGGPRGMIDRRKLAQKRSRVARERSRAIQERKMAEQSKRANSLEFALRERGLSLRGDSRLCDEFVRGVSRLSVVEIVDVMHEMDFFHNRTNYGEAFSRIVASARDCGEWWDRDEISEQAKEAALRAFQRGWDGSLEGIPPTIAERL